MHVATEFPYSSELGMDSHKCVHNAAVLSRRPMLAMCRLLKCSLTKQHIVDKGVMYLSQGWFAEAHRVWTEQLQAW